MALEKLFDPTVEPFDHTVCLRGARRCQAMFDVQIGTELVELVLDAARLRRPKRWSVNSFPFSWRIVWMRIGHARYRSRRKSRAFAAVFALKMRMKTNRVAW